MRARMSVDTLQVGDGHRVSHEWRLDKAQNFLIQGGASFRVRKLGAHDLAGEAAHIGEEFFDAAMLGNGLLKPVGLIGGESETDGLCLHLG